MTLKIREPFLGLGPFLVRQPPKKEKKGATEKLSWRTIRVEL